MGEAYRGLTIKIGADTSKLQSSMNQLQAAMRAIAADGRKLKTALATNPTSLDLARSNMRQLSETTRGTATQVAYLRKSLDQAGMAGKSASQLIQRFGSSDLKLANMRNSFNDINTELERVWDKLRRFIAGTNDVNSDEWKEAASYVTQLKTQLSTAEGKLREMGARTAENAQQWDKWEQKVREVKAGIQAAFTTLGGKLPYGAENVEQLINVFDRLRIAQKRQQQSLEMANKNVGIKNAAVDMQVFEENVRATNAQLTEMLGKQRVLGEGAAREAAVEMEKYAGAAKEAKAVVSAMDDALKSNPASIEAAIMKFGALKDQIKMVGEAIRAAETRQKSLNAVDIAGVKQQYGTIANAVRETGNALTEANTKADGFKGSLRQAISEAKMLREQVSAGNATSAEYEKAVANVRELRHEYVSAKAAAKAANDEFNRANDAKAVEDLRHELAALKAEYASLNAAMFDSSARMANISQSIRTMGYGLYSTVTPAIMMTGMYMINAANDIDAAYRDMRKTVNGTEEDFVHLKDAAIEYSRSHVTSAKDMLEIEAIGGQLGIQVQNLEKFGQVVSNLDIATNMSAENISENLGQLSAIMKDMDQSLQTGPGSMEAFSNALVRLGNNAPAQEDKIMNVMMRIASMGTVCKMTTPDLLGLSTAVAATGQGSEAAGTAISKTFSQIESAVGGGAEALAKFGPIAEMNGEELAEYQEAIESSAGKLEKFAEVAGMSAQDFANSWKNTPTEAFTAFIQGLKRIDESGGSAANTLTELGINSQRQRQTLLGLTNTVGNMNDYLTMSNDAWNGLADQWGNAGDAAYEAQQKSQGFSGQLEILKHNAEALANEAAQALVTPMQILTHVFGGLTSVVKAMPGPMKGLLTTMGALAGIAGPLAVGIGSTIDGWQKLKKAVTGGKDAWTVVTKANKDAATAASNVIPINQKAASSVEGVGRAAESSAGRLQRFGNAAKTAVRSIGATVGVMAGIAVASMAIDAAISAYEKWRDECTKVEESHKTMTDRIRASISNAASATQSETEKSAGYVSNYSSYLDRVSESHARLGEMADKTFAKSGLIKEYSDTIASIATNGAKSSDDMLKLTAAVDGYNDATGSSIEVTQDENGALHILADGAEITAERFRELADAKKAAAEADYYQEEYEASKKNNEESEKNYAAAKKRVADLEKAIEEAQPNLFEGENDYRTRIEMMTSDLNKARRDMKYFGEQIGVTQSEMNQASEDWQLAQAVADGAANAAQRFVMENALLRASIHENSQSTTQFASVLNGLGLSYDQLKDKSSVIDEMGNRWDGTMRSVLPYLDQLGVKFDDATAKAMGFRDLQIGDKHYYVTDDGTVATEEGKIAELRVIQIGGKHYYVTDDGTVYDNMGQVQDLNALGIDPKLWYTDDSGTTRLKQEEVVQLNAEKIENKDFWVTAYDNASGTLEYIRSLSDSIPRNITQTVTTMWDSITGKHAWGGPFSDSRTIAHAAGGYFVDKPTVIGRSGNVTHIAGEAGREYVSTHANGGMVLPLTDPYMRPWVNAVAQQMGGMGGNYNITIIGAPTESPEQFAHRFTRAVARQQRTGRIA